MDNLHKRILLFLFGCMGARLMSVWITKNYTEYLHLFGYIALLPVIGWLYILFINQRTTGPEVFGGTIWWNSMRPIHIILYSLFAFNAIYYKNQESWKFLMIDVIIGFTAFTLHHLNF